MGDLLHQLIVDNVIAVLDIVEDTIGKIVAQDKFERLRLRSPRIIVEY